MNARVATFEGGKIETAAPFAGDAQATGTPELVRELFVFAEKVRDRRLLVSIFDDESDIEPMMKRLNKLEDDVEEERRGHRTMVETYEVIIREVSGQPKHALMTWTELPTEIIDDVVEAVHSDLLSKVRELGEWRGALALANRDTGAARFFTFYDDLETANLRSPRLEVDPSDLLPHDPASMPQDEELTVALRRQM